MILGRLFAGWDGVLAFLAQGGAGELARAGRSTEADIFGATW